MYQKEINTLTILSNVDCQMSLGLNDTFDGQPVCLRLSLINIVLLIMRALQLNKRLTKIDRKRGGERENEISQMASEMRRD